MAKQKLTQQQKDLHANEKKFITQTKRSLRTKGILYIDNLIDYYQNNTIVDERLVDRETALTTIKTIKQEHLHDLYYKQQNGRKQITSSN